MSDEDEAGVERHTYTITDDEAGMRLDKALAKLAPDLSRSRIQSLIDEGALTVNALPCSTASRKVKKGSVVELIVPPLKDAEPQAEDIPLDVVFEDEHVLVINKPAGLVVHPGAGNQSGTLVNALLHHCKDDLSGIGGVARPGIVHRLDKDTSGLLIVAKHDKAHQGLSAQLQDRSLTRIYDAIVLGVPVPIKGQVDMPIGRDPHNRLKMSVRPRGGKEARTHYLVKENFGDVFSHIECKLESGRTHQIRVHMQSIKHPLIGDPLYGPQKTALVAALKRGDYDENDAQILDFPRQALHARHLSFIHPATEETLNFEIQPPEDFSKLLKYLNKN